MCSLVILRDSTSKSSNIQENVFEYSIHFTFHLYSRWFLCDEGGVDGGSSVDEKSLTQFVEDFHHDWLIFFGVSRHREFSVLV